MHRQYEKRTGEWNVCLRETNRAKFSLIKIPIFQLFGQRLRIFSPVVKEGAVSVALLTRLFSYVQLRTSAVSRHTYEHSKNGFKI